MYVQALGILVSIHVDCYSLRVFTTAYFSYKVEKCKENKGILGLGLVRYSSGEEFIAACASLYVRHSSGRYSLHPPKRLRSPFKVHFLLRAHEAAVRSRETENISETSSSLSHDPNKCPQEIRVCVCPFDEAWVYVCTWVQRGERMLGVAIQVGVGLPMIHT